MIISIKKTALAALTAAAVIASLAAPASAQHYHGGDVGAGIAAGILGGAMLGAAAANAGPGPVYVEEAPDCWMERRPVYDDYGNFVGRRRVRVCR